MEITLIIFQVAVLVLSVAIHEASHGFMADYLGDPTPRLQGRLTLNPLKHLDLIGSVVVPLLLVVTKSPIILGWAKPVLFNPLNIKNRRYGGAMVAIAGPLSNIALALVIGLFARFGDALGFGPLFIQLLGYIVHINLVLVVFNLIPVAPLDGHHILYALLGPKNQGIIDFLQRSSFWVLLVIVFFLWRFISPISDFLYKLIVG